MLSLKESSWSSTKYFLLGVLVKLGQPVPELYLSVEIKRGSHEIERRLCSILLSYIIANQ
jgi:hypothetical protein